ncbi:MAG: class I SAM-dependent methyltransferase [Tissierellia bacterium]|nr:class I SAM-dependent methyltransferase [Tissierellia bacterium]
MLKKYFKNVIKPQNNFSGKLMVSMMNKGHKKLSLWGMKFLEINPDDIGIDLGCGGGMNIKEQLKKAKKVYGLDYSEVSVQKTKELNSKEILNNRCEVFQGNVLNIPLPDNTCDYATAFETVYFWTDIIAAFKEVKRILKAGGKFLIVNEICDPKKGEYWIKTIDLRIYEDFELEEILNLAGFKNIEINVDKKSSNIAIVSEKLEE